MKNASAGLVERVGQRRPRLVAARHLLLRQQARVERGGGLLVRPVAGSALLWFNTLPDGTPDERSVHASLPLRSGEKWALSQWMRERPYLDRT